MLYRDLLAPLQQLLGGANQTLVAHYEFAEFQRSYVAVVDRMWPTQVKHPSPMDHRN